MGTSVSPYPLDGGATGEAGAAVCAEVASKSKVRLCRLTLSINQNHVESAWNSSLDTEI